MNKLKIGLTLVLIFSSFSSFGELIPAGHDAEPGEFPSLVAVHRSGSMACIGSLIANQWAATAGHCCDGLSGSMLSVVVGSFHLYEEDQDQEDIQVEAVYLHPYYDSWTISNDICLLKLETAITIGPNVDILPLPEDMEEYEPGTMCTFAGWGNVGDGGLAPVVQKDDIPVVSDETCEMSMTGIASSMLCAGFKQGGGGPCNGDSGGPLMCGKQLSGINSWGYGCGLADTYTVYTQTSYFVPWINEIINSS